MKAIGIGCNLIETVFEIRVEDQLATDFSEKPTDKLISIFAECETDPSHFICNLVDESCELFTKSFDTFESKLVMSRQLFWKLLESILLEERSRVEKIGTLLQNDIVIKSIMAASIEIILWSFQSVKQFKSVIDLLKLDCYQFYKVNFANFIEAIEVLSPKF